MKYISFPKMVYVVAPMAGLAMVFFLLSFKPSSTDTKEFDLAPFTELEIDCACNVQYTQASATSAQVNANAEDLQDVQLQVKDGVLTISLKGGKKYQPIKIALSTPVLKKVTIAGSGNFTSVNTMTPGSELLLTIAGSGNMDIDVETDQLKTEIAGSGNIILDGKAKRFSIEIAGSGNCTASKLQAGDVFIDIAGSGSAYVKLKGKLDVTMAGSGSVYYKGDPTEIEKDIAGSGRVRRKD